MMDRRSFLKNMLWLVAGVTFLSVLGSKKIVEAAWNAASEGNGIDPLLNIPIKETYLQFTELENRRTTDTIIVHHIGNTNSDVSAAQVHEWHLNNGWSGIGYHFVIRKDGTIERGRPMNMEGAHCYKHNWHTVGINIVGEFSHHEPTEAQMESAATLMAALCRYYRLTPSRKTIKGHREFNATECPGDNLYYRLTELVDRTKQQFM